RGGGSDRVVPWEYRVAADGTGADPGNQAGSVSSVVASRAGSRGRPAVQRVLSSAADVQSLTGFTKESFVLEVARRDPAGSRECCRRSSTWTSRRLCRGRPDPAGR